MLTVDRQPDMMKTFFSHPELFLRSNCGALIYHSIYPHHMGWGARYGSNPVSAT